VLATNNIKDTSMLLNLPFAIHYGSVMFHSTGLNLGQGFNSRSGCMYAKHLLYGVAKRPNLELKTWSKQLFGYLPLDIAHPG